ncbi:MAG: PTS sugar transporter subunit IIA [Spirochaetaceae bacterium]|nr:PTS sugar transporter subunit IIA [Spirochaetaceae bacterium]
MELYDEIMTLPEVADYLKIATKTVTRMIKRKEIPCIKLSGQWRFKKSSIDSWLNSKMQMDEEGTLISLLGSTESEIIPLSRLIHSSMIISDIKRGSVKDIIHQLTKPLREMHILDDTTNLESNLLKREQMMSTSISDKVAFPHLRNSVDIPAGLPPIILGVCKEGTKYNEKNGNLTHIFFLILANNDIAHLRLLSKLATFSNKDQTVSSLIEAKDNNEITKIFMEDEYENMAKLK